MRIEFSPPDINEADIAAVSDALRSGWITTGPKTKKFEQELAKWCQTGHVACLNSATAALECALRLLDIGPGDEVITPAYTYTATAAVICHVGATPVLVDTAPGSYEMNYERMAAAVTKRTKAIIAVDIAGVMCDYERIFEAVEGVREHYTPKPDSLQAAFDRVVVIADGAHSFGATYKGQPSGSVADFTAFSFHAVKNLTTAEGGALTWRPRVGIDDEALYKQLMLLSLHGQSKDALAKLKPGAWEYDIVAPLYKCNMTDICAALGLSQLERYPQMLKRRHEILASYSEGLAGLEVEILAHRDGEPGADRATGAANQYVSGAQSISSAHLCMLRLTGRSEQFRNRLIESMAARNISCNVHYKPLPLLSAYKKLGFNIADYPCAYAQYQNELTLPLYSKLNGEQVAYILESFKDAYEECVRAGV